MSERLKCSTSKVEVAGKPAAGGAVLHVSSQTEAAGCSCRVCVWMDGGWWWVVCGAGLLRGGAAHRHRPGRHARHQGGEQARQHSLLDAQEDSVGRWSQQIRGSVLY